MTATEVLIYGLATWRISSILVHEAGPWDVFVRLRTLAGIGHDKNRQAVIIPDGFFASILSCIWCCSVWVGLGWMALAWFIPLISIWLAAGLAFSTVAVVVQRYVET